MNRFKDRSIVTLLLALSLLGGRSRADGARYTVPEGLTLQAKAGGRYLLLWEPLDGDALMGYSVWLRRQGEKEFVRLSVPVKVGKEIQKQPMVNEAKLELKLGEGRRDLEFAVVAEYEDGPSARSASVYSAKAAVAKVAPAPADAVATGPAAGSPISPTAAAKEAPVAKRDPYADEDRKAAPEGPAPWNRTARMTRPLLVPAGKLRTHIGGAFQVIHSTYNDTEPFGDLQLYGTGIPFTKVVNWKRVDQRTIFTAPLRAEFGLLPGVELWAEGVYHAEDVSINTYHVDGQDFSNIHPFFFNPDGSISYVPNPSSAGIGDSPFGVRLCPLPSQPLVLQAKMVVPIGPSRMQSYLDWVDGKGYAAGLSEGITRVWGRVDWGWRGLRPGPSFHLAYSPGSAEKVTETFAGIKYHDLLTHGDIGEAGVAYTLPWKWAGKEGALIPYATIHSISPAHWTLEGFDRIPDDKITRSEIAAHALVKFNRDDQLEFGVEANQDLPGGFETGGRLSYSTTFQGEEMQISGRLVY